MTAWEHMIAAVLGVDGPDDELDTTIVEFDDAPNAISEFLAQETPQ